MILVLGGTTEGRKAVATLDKAGKPFFYSTRGGMQQVESRNAMRLSGALDSEALTSLCQDNGIKLIIDAAHPFATKLHENVKCASEALSIPVVRFERTFPQRDDSYTWCDDFDDAVMKLKAAGVRSLLSLTGVQTIARLKDFWQDHDCIFRILDREDSISIAAKNGFPPDKLVYYEADGHISNLLLQHPCDAILTKESGDSGKFQEKTADAINAGARIFVVKRPALPEGFTAVTGEYGLRKAVEKLLPGFYELRSGFTTGTCATAAAVAALTALTTGTILSEVGVTLPAGELMTLPVEEVSVSASHATASVIKDAGDDPDVTDGATITASVTLAGHKSVRFFGGEGIGTVTLPGTGLNVGEPAINPVPRQMMTDALLKIYPEGCDVTISVPGGEALSGKTFNARIGIIGGLSIIGTSGVVMPFSNEAFLESIRREFDVAIATGCPRIVINSGARSEMSVKSLYPDLPASAFIHYGNAIGDTLRIADELEIKELTAGVMLGKAVKLAEGNMDTHSHKVTMNRKFLAGVAKEAGCSEEAITIMSNLNMAREMWQSLSAQDADRFFPAILRLCEKSCRRIYLHGSLRLILIDDSGAIRYSL